MGDFRGLKRGYQNPDPLFGQKPECRNAPKTQDQGDTENDPLFDHFLVQKWTKKGSKRVKKEQKTAKNHSFLAIFTTF